MIEILGIKFTYEALAFLALFAASELLPFLNVKGNGLADLVLKAAHLIKPYRTEDEKVTQLVAKVKELGDIVKE
jgi:hypothetical protein